MTPEQVLEVVLRLEASSEQLPRKQQEAVAEAYAQMLQAFFVDRSGPKVSVVKVNQAIADRWGWTGLRRVKRLAWELADPVVVEQGDDEPA